jgi:hypothetical protein
VGVGEGDSERFLVVRVAGNDGHQFAKRRIMRIRKRYLHMFVLTDYSYLIQARQECFISDHLWGDLRMIRRFYRSLG